MALLGVPMKAEWVQDEIWFLRNGSTVRFVPATGWIGKFEGVKWIDRNWWVPDQAWRTAI